MLSQEYREAFTETLDILEHTNSEDVNKISSKFLNFIKENASKTYKPNLDHTKRIKDMQLKQKTIGILTIIYRNFWCTDEQRKEFDEKIGQNEMIYQKELSEKYNLDKLFKNKRYKKIY